MPIFNFAVITQKKNHLYVYFVGANDRTQIEGLLQGAKMIGKEEKILVSAIAPTHCHDSKVEFATQAEVNMTQLPGAELVWLPINGTTKPGRDIDVVIWFRHNSFRTANWDPIRQRWVDPDTGDSWNTEAVTHFAYLKGPEV